jgi:hypothetical protein
LNASKQVDMCALDVDKPYQAGICMLPESDRIRGWTSSRAQTLLRIEQMLAGWLVVGLSSGLVA